MPNNLTPEKLKAVWEALQWGTYIDARDLSDLAGLDRGRTCEQFRSAVRWLRSQGLPIVSGQFGYKKTVDPSEIAKCANNLFRRAASTHQRGVELLDRIVEGWSMSGYDTLAIDIIFEEEGFDGETET